LNGSQAPVTGRGFAAPVGLLLDAGVDVANGDGSERNITGELGKLVEVV
jgi:hypothetical protein